MLTLANCILARTFLEPDCVGEVDAAHAKPVTVMQRKYENITESGLVYPF